MTETVQNKARPGLEILKAALDQPKNSQAVEEVVTSILSSVDSEVAGLDLMLYKEIVTLSQYIQESKQQIAFIPAEINTLHIPNATDELDAVVLATEDATGKILDAAEIIESVSGEVSEEQAAKLTQATTQIYEASSFQDITGQRITKVVTTLKNIEERVKLLLSRFSDGLVMNEIKNSQNSDGAKGDKALMSGPQLADKAKGQDEIDDIFKNS